MRAEGEPGVETVGERLRRLRHECGLSQRELASPGVSYAYISRIEAGARRPSVKALRQLAPKLGVSVEYLETGRDLSDRDQRELRLSEAELTLRLEQDSPEAEAEFAALLAEAQAAGDAEAAARARAGLGELADRRGDFATAIEELEQARAAGVLSPLTHADLYATLARAYSASGQPRRAVELLEDCLSRVQAQAPEDVSAEGRFATYLSYALSDLGELHRRRVGEDDAAERLARQALSLLAGGDPLKRARAYATLAEARPEEIDALQAEFAQALEVLEAERRWPAAASVLRTWSRALRRAGREQAALDVLDRAAAYGVRGSGQPAGERL